MPRKVKSKKEDNLDESDKSDKEILMGLKTHICKIHNKSGSQDNGFFCLIKDESKTIKILITNNHVLDEKDIQPGQTIYYSTNNKEKCQIVIDNTRKIFTNKEYDVTIIEIKKEDEIDEESFFNLDNQIFQDKSPEIFKNSQIYLLYDSKQGLQISSGEIKRIEEKEYKIFYSGQTIEGCSGCPIINKENFQVIGIHIGEYTKEECKIGSLLKKPIELFIQFLGWFQENEEFKEESKCIYKSSYNFIPQINLKFNDVKIIDKEIIDSLYENVNKIFKGKDVKIIEIRKGSLSIILALNYLIKENLEKINKDKADDILSELNKYLKIECKDIKTILLNNLIITQKDKKYKPDFATQNLCDLESEFSKDELVKLIRNNKNNNNDTNIYEISKSISRDDIKKFFDSLYIETKKTQENLYDSILKDIYYELDNYLKIFEEQFEEALKKSIFEYKTKYMAYVYRYDDEYNSAQLRCENIEKKILFHGTNSFSISRILSSNFRDSTKHIFGPGIYFSDSLDYTWFYADDSGKIGSRKNFKNIPAINDTFSFIVVNAYFDKTKFEQVYDCSTQKIPVPDYGIRYILVNYRSSAIPKNDLNNYNNKFKGTEYLISNRKQILPLLSVTVERVKYLIVWRDNNFNINNPNNYSKYEKMLKYNNNIKNYAAFDLSTKIYFLNESNEALELIKRKKYNKIILITNGGNGGKDFITNARKIIGKDTIALVTCYVAKNHLSWVKEVDNVLLNCPLYDCMKDFLKNACNEDLNGLKNLQKKTEEEYKKLDQSFLYKEINNQALDFPKFKEKGSFDDIDFND